MTIPRSYPRKRPMTALEKWMEANDYSDEMFAEALGLGLEAAKGFRRGLTHPSLFLGLQTQGLTGIELEDLLPRGRRK